MYSLSFAAAFTMPEAVAAFIFKDGTRKVHALKKKKKHSVEQKKSLSLKRNTTNHVLLFRISYCYKRTFEYLTCLDPQFNIPPPGNRAPNFSTAKSPSPC